MNHKKLFLPLLFLLLLTTTTSNAHGFTVITTPESFTATIKSIPSPVTGLSTSVIIPKIPYIIQPEPITIPRAPAPKPIVTAPTVTPTPAPTVDTLQAQIQAFLDQIWKAITTPIINFIQWIGKILEGIGIHIYNAVMGVLEVLVNGLVNLATMIINLPASLLNTYSSLRWR